MGYKTCVAHIMRASQMCPLPLLFQKVKRNRMLVCSSNQIGCEYVVLEHPRWVVVLVLYSIRSSIWGMIVWRYQKFLEPNRSHLNTNLRFFYCPIRLLQQFYIKNWTLNKFFNSKINRLLTLVKTNFIADPP